MNEQIQRFPLVHPGDSKVIGVIVRRRDDGAERPLRADLVLDASGRGSQSPKWLDEWGFGRPATTTVKVDVGYATRVFERRQGDFYESIGGVISSTPPAQSRLAAVLAAEGGRWVITLAGSLGDHPPADERGWLAFAASLPSLPCTTSPRQPGP